VEKTLLNANGHRRNVIIIGASAGGLDALIVIFERLPASLPAGTIREDDVDGAFPADRLADVLTRLAEGASLDLDAPLRG
jgi:chemotaxis response regulator CheB